MLLRNPLASAARSELLVCAGHSCLRQLQEFRPFAPPPPCPLQDLTGCLLMMVLKLLSALCSPQSLIFLPFPEGSFVQSTTCPRRLCGSAAFAESLAPEACKIPRLATVSLDFRSHYARLLKLEGHTRRNLPIWKDHLGPPDTFSGRCEVFLCLFQYKHVLSFLLGFSLCQN